jgi:hypothetical protein
MQEEIKFPLPTTFTDNRGREWEIKLTIPVVHNFCKANHVALGGFHPHNLDMSQLLDIAFDGTRYQARAKDQTKDEFFDTLDGEAFTEAIGMACNAVVNFMYRTASKEARPAIVAMMQAAKEMSEEVLSEHGLMSTDLQEEPESTSQELDTV